METPQISHEATEPDDGHGGDRGRPTVALLGVGALGTAVAGALLDAARPTTVWNRSPGRDDALVARGATRAAAVIDAVAASDILIMTVTDHDAVREALDPASHALRDRTIVNLTSGTPEQARTTATWARTTGAEYLDGAAMSGTRLIGTPEAVFLYSGSQRAFARAEATLAGLGGATYLGTDPALGSLYDSALLTVNMGLLSGFYQAVALVGTAGVGAAAFAPIVTGYLPFATGLLAQHAGQIDDGRYPPDDGSVEVLEAAMDHVVATSRRHGLGADVPEGIRRLLERAVAAGHGGQGVASLVEMIRPGTAPPSP